MFGKKKLLRDDQILDEVLDYGDAPHLAKEYGCSAQLINGWQRPPSDNDDEYKTTGTGRPSCLTRLRILISFIISRDGKPNRAYPIAKWVARQCWGVFVPLSTISYGSASDLMQNVSKVMKETGEAIEAVRKAWYEVQPGIITKEQAINCRTEIAEAQAALAALEIWLDEKEQE